jgi:hypothetical protein
MIVTLFEIIPFTSSALFEVALNSIEKFFKKYNFKNSRFKTNAYY